jgi:hypothetical protein
MVAFLGNLGGVDYYNLGFGDFDDKEGQINDLSVTGNEDRDKVLATVAFTVLEFTNHFPGCMIMVEGSTRSRTRLYQMRIAKYYSEILQIFDIQGLTGLGSWVAFKGGENYLALLIARK